MVSFMSNAITTESIIAAIESGALGAGYTCREDVRTETVSHIIVTRYGRRASGHIRITDSGYESCEIDIDQLKVPGLSDDTILATLRGAS